MGLLVSKLWRQLFGNGEYKILIVGLDNAGKTTVLYKLLLNETVTTNPTIGSNVEEVTYRNIKFLMWDLGGQESLRTTWSTYYTNTQAIIMVVDSSDRDRLYLVKEELHRMMLHEQLKKSAILIFANKQDVEGAHTAGQISEALNLSAIRDQTWHIQACCALTGDGLTEGLDWIVHQLTGGKS
ncbi:ADP-ribosylation factor-like protein 5B [Sorochytrium milnesiophthora]